MKQPIVVLGMGELGSVFARSFLKNNHPVYPITRTTNVNELVQNINPELVLVCTGEADLQEVLGALPDIWKDRVVLMQNELLPRDWQGFDFANPTLISVWFEKKKGMDSKVLIASPAFGKKAHILQESLALIDIPVRILADERELLFELVVKNLYILTTNIAGLALKNGANVDDLRTQKTDLMWAVFADVLQLQKALTQQNFKEVALKDAMMMAFEGDLMHQCKGRSASARLERVLEVAQNFNIATPALTMIQQKYI
jgi:ketopantoate reductase